jgi:drug/metabolite transporter (DMT)-like permease
MNNTRIKAHTALFLSGILFGLNYWVAKEIMPEPMQPRQIIFIRILAAAVFFSLLALSIKRETVLPKHKLLIALSSLLGVSVNQIFFFEGLNLTTPVDAAILHAASPIIVVVFAGILISEKLSLVNVAGILAGMAGAVILVLSGKEVQIFSGNMLGNLFIVINLTAYALYLVLMKPVMKLYHPFTVMKWVFLFGLAGVLPFTTHTMFSISPEIFSLKIMASLAYIIIGTTMAAYILTIYGLKHLKAGSVGYYIYLQPVMAGFIGIVWFSEVITAAKIIAALLIFTGVYFVNRKRPKVSDNGISEKK